MKGKLWWIAENDDELQEWVDQYFMQDGVSVLNLARLPKDDGRIQVVFELEKLHARRLLGYTPEKEEWLES